MQGYSILSGAFSSLPDVFAGFSLTMPELSVFEPFLVKKAGGSQYGAAELLGVAQSTLWRKVKKNILTERGPMSEAIQKRKSRFPSCNSVKCSIVIARTFLFVMEGISFLITSSPIIFVSGDA
jgi:predicted DNA-binding protein (UPF0251 family)